MKKHLKLIALSGLLTLSACATTAAQYPRSITPSEIDTEILINNEAEEISYEEKWDNLPEFMNFSGAVVDIQPFYFMTEEGEALAEGMFNVVLEAETNSEGYANRVTFIVDQESVLLRNPEIGMKVTGFYDSSFPASMIYPAQFRATALIPNDQGVMLERFNENFFSSDGTAAILLSEDTEIVFQDGTVFEEEFDKLINRALVVIYDREAVPISSAEALDEIIPEKIIVLYERAVHPTLTLTEEDLVMFDDNDSLQGDEMAGSGLQISPEDLYEFWSTQLDTQTIEVFVEGNSIDMPPPFISSKSGHVMVPAAYVAEALGYTISGEGEDLVIGQGIAFTVDVDNYHYMRMAPIQLGAVPELRDGVTFVPLSFFGAVIPATSFIMDGNIFVQNLEEYSD